MTTVPMVPPKPAWSPNTDPKRKQGNRVILPHLAFALLSLRPYSNSRSAHYLRRGSVPARMVRLSDPPPLKRLF